MAGKSAVILPRGSSSSDGGKESASPELVEIALPEMLTAKKVPTMFGGPNSGNIGWRDMPKPKALTGGAKTPFVLDDDNSKTEGSA